MRLSRKHFKALADIVRDIYGFAQDARTINPDAEVARGRQEAADHMKFALADFCAGHTPNFDRARFLAACEPQE